jgi:hypothetical protein
LSFFKREHAKGVRCGHTQKTKHEWLSQLAAFVGSLGKPAIEEITKGRNFPASETVRQISFGNRHCKTSPLALWDLAGSGESWVRPEQLVCRTLRIHGGTSPQVLRKDYFEVSRPPRLPAFRFTGQSERKCWPAALALRLAGESESWVPWGLETSS